MFALWFKSFRMRKSGDSFIHFKEKLKYQSIQLCSFVSQEFKHSKSLATVNIVLISITMDFRYRFEMSSFIDGFIWSWYWDVCWVKATPINMCNTMSMVILLFITNNDMHRNLWSSAKWIYELLIIRIRHRNACYLSIHSWK